MNLLLSNSPITGFDYYTNRQGDEYTLYVRMKPHYVPAQVREAAFDEIDVGQLREHLRLRGVKGKTTLLMGSSVGGYLPIAQFDGRSNPMTPGVHQRC